MKKSPALLRNQKGFTLIEMAIVLVIIGLILGAVIKGRDVINSAKQKKFHTAFIKSWELAIASYYDRTGNVLGDGLINGGTAATRDGFIDIIDTAGEFTNIDNRLKAVGLEVPTTNTSTSYQYSYSGNNGSSTISAQIRTLGSATDGVTRNVIYLPNIPTDLAIALDTIIDGETGTATGTFRRYQDNAGDWPDVTVTALVNAMYLVNIP